MLGRPRTRTCCRRRGASTSLHALPTQEALHASLAAEYAAAASSYDARWVAYTTATVAATLGLLPRLEEGAVVLDLACGTGALARGLAARGEPLCEYVGVDLSKEMLREASSQALPFSARWLCAPADDALPLASGTVDVVLCANSFHFFADQRRCLAEATRVLRPGGLLILADWNADYWTCQLLEWVLARKGAPSGNILRVRDVTQLVAAQPGLCVDTLVTPRLLFWWGYMVVRSVKER